jgi:hypothetical protein
MLSDWPTPTVAKAAMEEAVVSSSSVRAVKLSSVFLGLRVARPRSM